MSSFKVKTGLLNSLILIVLAVYVAHYMGNYLIGGLLLLASAINMDITGTLYDEQKRLELLREFGEAVK
jgi:hypothetical protein